MRSINIKILFIGGSLVINATSCTKYLEAKSDSSLSVPQTLEDIEALVDTYSKLNAAVSFSNESADEYYLSSELWNSFPNPYKGLYIWDAKVENRDDWVKQYNAILYANTILDNLAKIPAGDQVQKWNHYKGAALFFRAYSFYQIAQLYAKPYVKETADRELGIPLRLSSDFNKPSNRGTLQQTYDRVIQDIQDAILLLPDNAPFLTRPSKPAAYGLLARVYLQMGNFEKALDAANSCLQLKDSLMNFNSLDASSSAPIPIFNEEVLFYNENMNSLTGTPYALTDSVLVKMFKENDLRKNVLLQDHGDGTFHFKGSYNGMSNNLFQGIATDEIFLIRSECYARLGNTARALDDLNTLLINRWKTGEFVPVTASGSDEALHIILQERRKELISRGIRWSDIRRLNSEGKFVITLKRVIAGVTYELPPNDVRFALLIPVDIINLSGIQQNER